MLRFPTFSLSRIGERLDRMPMLKVLVPLAAGIALAEHYALPGWFLATAFLATGTAAMLLRSSLCTVAMLLTAGFAAAQLRDGEPTVPRDVPTLFQLRIEGIPAQRNSYSTAEGIVTAWRSPVDGKWYPAGDRVVVRADSLVRLDAGDRLRCRSVVRPFRKGAESYRRLMRRRGYAGSLWISERNLMEQSRERHGTLHTFAAERLSRLELPAEADAVVRAMAAGDRSGITPELRALYSRSGFSHLLAVSGLHTGIVFLLVNFLSAWLPLFRRGHLLRNVFAAAAVWLFVAAAGFPVSAVRAAVMCSLLQFALASASEYVALNALSAAAVGMLLWNPAWLGDIGFRLSFVAVGAILAWGVPLCRRVRTGHRVPDAVLHAYLIGVVATVATAPLVSHTFGIVPLAGVLFNPAAILLAGAVVLCGAVWMVVPVGALAPLCAFAVEKAVAGIHALALLCLAVPGGVTDHALGSIATTALYLFFAVATLMSWSAEPKKNVHLPM